MRMPQKRKFFLFSSEIRLKKSRPFFCAKLSDIDAFLNRWFEEERTNCYFLFSWISVAGCYKLSEFFVQFDVRHRVEHIVYIHPDRWTH
ncbi:Uncharacterized protein APZ42_021261 [Daphnia magna]|uniref:Uncharacterized protein n=1 Tax=Daphnia magna TaxID=35525 RepID=A0A164WTV7_9CRUS|nr:Uncharacterized protein APZ42_021261 [Daphnia magna]